MHPQQNAIVNLSGYRFVELEHLPLVQADLFAALDATGIKGTVLIAEEGINAALAGTNEQTTAVREWFAQDERFASMWLKQSLSQTVPFSKLKVKIRHEIISFLPGKERAYTDPVAAGRVDSAISPATNPAPAMPPGQLQEWLAKGKDFTLLDTRNSYEISSGTFEQAVELGIETFRDFTDALAKAVDVGDIDPDKPVVTFCTGGIRCEKAAPYMLANGFKDVFQVEGGILNYFEQCGGEHWQGDCFVFDDRVEISPELQPTGASLCTACHRAIPANASGCNCTQTSRVAIDTV